MGSALVTFSLRFSDSAAEALKRLGICAVDLQSHIWRIRQYSSGRMAKSLVGKFCLIVRRQSAGDMASCLMWMANLVDSGYGCSHRKVVKSFLSDERDLAAIAEFQV